MNWTTLGDASAVRSGGTPNRETDEFWGGPIPWLTARDLKTFRISSAIQHLTLLGAKQAKIAPKGSLVILVRGMTLFKDLPIGFLENDMAFNQDIKAIELSEDADAEFVGYQLVARKKRIRRFVDTAGHGTGRLDTDLLKSVPIFLPSLPEQKKIAAFLGAVDARIAGARRRRDLLETYKRGLMQALFSRTLRFTRPDGTAFPDWEEKRLGDYLVPHRERAPANTSVPIYSSSREGLKAQKDYFADRELSNEGEYGIVPNGYLTYRHMSDDLTFKFNINELGKPIAVSKEYPVFTTDGVVSRYLLYWLNFGSEFRRFAAMQKLGGTRTRLYFKNLSNWRVHLPHPDEQQKIADALSAMDAKIDAVSAKITQLEAFKKGLLQQMFA